MTDLHFAINYKFSFSKNFKSTKKIKKSYIKKFIVSKKRYSFLFVSIIFIHFKIMWAKNKNFTWLALLFK